MLVLAAVFIWLGSMLLGLWGVLFAHPELHETRVWFERSALANVATFAGKASLVGVCVFPAVLMLFDRMAQRKRGAGGMMNRNWSIRWRGPSKARSRKRSLNGMDRRALFSGRSSFVWLRSSCLFCADVARRTSFSWLEGTVWATSLLSRGWP